MRDDKDVGREAGPQPDPMLRERLSPAWIWTIAIACVFVVVLLLIAISPPLTNTADVVNGRPQSAPSATPPPARSPGSNTTGSGGSSTSR